VAAVCGCSPPVSPYAGATRGRSVRDLFCALTVVVRVFFH
jgi:hypothetical protein